MTLDDARCRFRVRPDQLIRLGGFGVTLLAIVCQLCPAEARLTQRQLAGVFASPAPDARAPNDLRFEDALSGRATTLRDALDGRAVLLLPVDYTCANVCDPMLSMTGAALHATGLRAGTDYGLVLVGIDPRDSAGAARRMLDEAKTFDSNEGVAALVGEETAVASLTRALGYAYAYDEATDSFAHPAAAMLLTPEGRVARVLSPLALNGRDLRFALVEAGDGRVGTLNDRLALLCYGFDAVKGVYTPIVQRILSLAAALTIIVIALGLFFLARRERRV